MDDAVQVVPYDVRDERREILFGFVVVAGQGAVLHVQADFSRLSSGGRPDNVVPSCAIYALGYAAYLAPLFARAFHEVQDKSQARILANLAEHLVDAYFTAVFHYGAKVGALINGR